MRTGTDTTRARKMGKKGAKMPVVKSAKKSVLRPSSDAVQSAATENQVAQDAAASESHSSETVISGQWMSLLFVLLTEFV